MLEESLCVCVFFFDCYNIIIIEVKGAISLIQLLREKKNSIHIFRLAKNEKKNETETETKLF